MKEIMYKVNDWACMTEASMVEGPIEKVIHKKLATAIKAMKPEKAAGSSEVLHVQK